MQPIYLDYAATTPIDKRVAEKMLTALELFGNSSSLHFYGQQAKNVIELAREQIAASIHADPREIIFTSGATESDNLAIKGASHLYARQGKHIITMKTEHKAVLDSCFHLEKEGYQVTYLSPEANGLLDINKLLAAIRPETILVSIMHVNNETGVIQDIAKIADVTSSSRILLHVDAAQSMGKLPLNVKQIPIDLLSLSAHKVYGPKGIGALYLRRKPRVRILPLFHGGGHEQGMRSGTLATHQIVGMGEAFALAQQEFFLHDAHIKKLQQQFFAGIKAIPNVRFNTDLSHCVPHMINMRFEGMLADAILKECPGIAASTAAACQAKANEGSYVLRAMGFSDEHIKSSIRFSFGRMTTEYEIEETLRLIKDLFIHGSGGKNATAI